MYNRSYLLKRYNQCLTANNKQFRHQTELLINGFIYNEPDVSGTKQQITESKILSLLCNMYGNIHMFNQSKILSFSDKLKLQKLISSSLYNRNISFKSTQLIYSAERDGFTHKSFYEKCKNYSNTLVLIESDPNSEDSNSENDYTSDSDYNANNLSEPNKIIFGGFTTKPWKINNLHVKDSNAFIYRLKANKYGSTIFNLNNYSQFALFQPPSPEEYTSDINDDEYDDIKPIFYFGQPVCLLISENCNNNYKSYCCGGEKSNYNIPYRGSILGVMHSANFKVVNIEVFHIVK